jgi:hypothetical protein
MSVAQKRRFLIWGKTAPDHSTKYYETVCTGAVLEDGSPIRLFPIPYRYLDDDDKFKKYQWMAAPISKDSKDTRPESYRIDCDGIELGDRIPSDDDEWGKRAAVMFQNVCWQFDSVDELAAAQAQTGRSIGVVVPTEITSVKIKEEPEDERQAFEAKMADIRRRHQADSEQLRLFEESKPDELKNLAFRKNRIYVQWRCGSGKSHNMQIMDWEVIEFQRKFGDDEAVRRIQDILNLESYAIRFFLGNLKSHPNRFTIVGLWYPKRRKTQGFFD